MPIITNDFSSKVATYRYFAVNIVTNQILAEIPFSDVSFERALKSAGSFSGTIYVAPDTKNLNLYENTMPGKTAIYVTRNNICIWGGIIWSRDYTLIDRSIKINASEFTSYLHHRYIWKTFNYDLSAVAYKETIDSKVKIVIPDRSTIFPEKILDNNGKRLSLKISFGEIGIGGYYNNYYDVLSYPAPGTQVKAGGVEAFFYIDIPNLPPRPKSYYSQVTVTSKVDTYEYVRKLITETFSDFSSIEFADTLVEPGITKGFETSYYQISNNIATVTTVEPHGLVVGQSVQLSGVRDILNNDISENESYYVTDIPSDTTYRFNFDTSLVNASITHSTRANLVSLPGVALVTLRVPDHKFAAGDYVNVSNVTTSGRKTLNESNVLVYSANVTHVFLYSYNTGNLSNAATNGKVILASISINDTPLSNKTYPIKTRRISETKSKKVTKVFAKNDIVTVVTEKPHYLKVGDVVIMKAEKAKQIYKYANGTVVKSNVLNIGTGGAEGAGILVTATPTRTTFSYSLFVPDLANNGVTLKNSTVNYSVPRRRIELDIYPGYSHDFVATDYVRVSGVDEKRWNEPLYDGYHTLTDVEKGDTPTWVQYAPLYDMSVEPGSEIAIAYYKYVLKNKDGVLVNKVYITTSGAHQLGVGDTINVSIKDSKLGGFATINSIISEKTFTYTPDTQGNKNITFQEISGTVTKTKSVCSSVSKNFKTITSRKRVKKTATITTSSAHGFFEDDYVLIDSSDSTFNNNDEPVKITDVLSSTKFSYESDGAPVNETATTGKVCLSYTNYGTALYPTMANCTNGSETREITCANHGLLEGDWITVFINKKSEQFSPDNTPVQVSEVINSNKFRYSTTAATATLSLSNLPSLSVITKSASITRPPVTIINSYGPLSKYSNLGGISFSTEDYSNLRIINNSILGGNLTNVGDHIDKYSNGLNGFEYRIDSSIQTVNGVSQFKRTFVFIPRKPESLTEYLENNPLSPGEYAPPSAFGADKLIFEYPGNISSVTLQENAENAATRIFIQADTKGSGSGSAPRYSAAFDSELLLDGWPVLDGSSKVEWAVPTADQINVDNWGNYDIEEDLHNTAERFLKESRPPMGEYSIVINGSLDPVVGSYDPGDWCQLIINDDFVKERLASNLEPRKNVILRKIESINVKVPNSPAFPEEITVNLVPEWQIDKSG